MAIATAFKFHLQLVTVVCYHFKFYEKNSSTARALAKFHVSIHLMTSVDREGIVSRKTCGNFDFMPLLKSYDNFKKFVSYLISKNTAFKHKI